LTPSCSHRSSTAARTPRHTWRSFARAMRWWVPENQARQPRVRGAVKSFGGRLPKCTAGTFHDKVAEHLPGELTSALEPILKTIASLTERIKNYYESASWRMWLRSSTRRPSSLEAGPRRGSAHCPVTFVLTLVTLEDPSRFAKSREVGAYLGLVPATDQSGGSDPEKHISKHGNKMMRKLCWSAAPTTSSAPSEKTPTSGVTEKGLPGEEARTPRRGRW
jgi:transposase